MLARAKSASWVVSCERAVIERLRKKREPPTASVGNERKSAISAFKKKRIFVKAGNNSFPLNSQENYGKIFISTPEFFTGGKIYGK